MTPVDSTPARKHLLARNPSVWLIVLTLSLLLGQAGAAAPLDLPPSSLLFLLVPIFFLFWREQRLWTLLVLLTGAAFSLGYVRHHQILHPTFPSDHLRSVINKPSQLYLEGVLYREPDRLPERSRWYFRAEQIWHPNGAQETQGNILITVRRKKAEWHYGDRIRLRVKVRPPRNFGNPGGFDYEAYLARRQIYLTGFLGSDARVELLHREKGSLWVWIEGLRREIRRFLERRLPPEQAALVKALVVGDRGGITKDMRESFVAAGVAHILAISGLHVGMLGLVVFLVARYLGSFSATLLLRFNLLKVATFFSFLAVLFYTALAGGMIPTVRSAIMIGVYVLAVLLDREDEVLSSLCLAALFIGLYWPGAVMEISFQLSFLAILFIVWGLRKIQQCLPRRRRDDLPQERSWLRHRLRPVGLYLAVPILATVGTGPMIAHHFGHLSLAGFLSNPLIVPLVGFLVVPLGLLIGLCSLFLPSLALLFLWVVEPLVSLLLWLVKIFSTLPLASIAVPIPNLVEVAALYLIVLSLLLLRRRSHLLLLLVGISLWTIGEGIYWWQERWDRKELRITHLSVGHGDAAVVEFPGSKVLLIDAGGTATGKFDIGKSIVAPFLRSRKILKVDYILVSHPRVDHYGGMKTIVEEFAPSEFWSGPSKGQTIRYQELEKAVRRSGIKSVLLSRGDSCRSIEQVRVCVLYPPEGKTGEFSVVVRLSFGRVNLLFAGDIKRRHEGVLLQQGADLSSVVLKVPRHGSLTSSTEEFIAAVKPKLAIFSAGHRNPFGLPREEVVERYQKEGAEILRTDQDGAIIIETDGEQIRYRTYRSGKKGEFLY